MTETAHSVVRRLLEDEGSADEIKREALAAGEGVDLHKQYDDDSFLRGYIDALFFSEEERFTEESGDETAFGIDDIDSKLAFQIYEDCKKFQEANAVDLEDVDLEKAGHDFWFTRNGHGVGFWDGDYEEGKGERLTSACEIFGGMELYIGDDNKIYGS